MYLYITTEHQTDISYSVWSFNSWQFQNCSVRPNEMCTGIVKVLGKCDKTVGWCMGNSSATFGTYCI